jgi:outer membrane protein assembly factor BamB
MDYATYYFATTIWAERDMELWAGFCIDDQGLLWINEQLACALPGSAKGTSIESVGMFRMRLRKGPNTVIVREDNEVHSMGMWLRVCVRGTPRPAEKAKAGMAAARERAAGLKAVPDNVRGWRGNWNGIYPDAAPPLAWDKDKRINVLWRASLGVGKGMPVIAGDRVIVASEPNFITCLDKMTGKRLWEREMNTLELKDPKLYAESQALLKAWKDAETGLFALENESAAADKGNERRKQLGGIARSGREKWWDFVCKNGGMRKSPSVWAGFLGLNMATPVTDGKHVWVKCAAGVTACFDVDGNRAWMVPTDFPGGGITIFSSPVLLDGKLIFELPTEEVAKGEGTCKKERVLKMVCFDGATGKPLWEARLVFNMQNGSSPAPMRLTNGKEDMAVVVTGGGRGPEARKGDYNELLHLGGTVVRADDGRILIGNLGVSSTWSSPIVDGDRIYHVGMLYATCTRLVMVNRDLVGAIRVWTADTCGHDGGVVANGDLLTGLDGGQWPGMVHYYDRDTGAEIRKPVNANTVFSKFGRGYCPPSFVGGHLFISDAGSGFAWTPRTTKMFAVQPGRKGRLVARNDLEPDTIPAPAFDGDRMYARTARALTCIGYTGDQGRAYEAEVVARTLMEDIPPAPPKAGDEKEILALPGLPVGVSPFASVPAHQTWHFVGPYPASESNSILSAMGGPALEGYRRGTNRNESGVKDLYMDVWNNRKFSVRRASQMLDLTAPIECQANTMAIYYWAFEVRQPRLVRVTADRSDVDLWISGNRVAD